MSAAITTQVPPQAAAAGPAALLGQFISKSPYRAMLAPIAAEVERVALQNVQIRTALETLAAQPGFRPGGMLRRPGPEERAIRAFLEFVAFASPAFLSSVGEWPMGQIRG